METNRPLGSKEGWQIYRNELFGFELEIPETWNACEEERVLGSTNTAIVFSTHYKKGCTFDNRAFTDRGPAPAIYIHTDQIDLDEYPKGVFGGHTFDDSDELYDQITREGIYVNNIDMVHEYDSAFPVIGVDFRSSYFFNTNDVGFELALVSSDLEGNLDLVSSQILSTFRFLDDTPKIIRFERQELSVVQSLVWEEDDLELFIATTHESRQCGVGTDPCVVLVKRGDAQLESIGEIPNASEKSELIWAEPRVAVLTSDGVEYLIDTNQSRITSQ